MDETTFYLALAKFCHQTAKHGTLIAAAKYTFRPTFHFHMKLGTCRSAYRLGRVVTGEVRGEVMEINNIFYLPSSNEPFGARGNVGHARNPA